VVRFEHQTSTKDLPSVLIPDVRLRWLIHGRFPDAESMRLDQPALATTLEELDALLTEAHATFTRWLPRRPEPLSPTPTPVRAWGLGPLE
jgi:hypothetical protein